MRHKPGLRWAGCLVVVVVVLCLFVPVSPMARAQDGVQPIVVVGTPGLTWADVSAAGTPALWSLLSTGAVGTMTARSVRPAACPVDGWLAVSAGRRAADAPGKAQQLCRTPTEPERGTVAGWSAYREGAADSSFDADLGLLGETLADDQIHATAIGPGAAIALAHSDGAVLRYRARPEDPDELAAAIGEVLRDSLVVVVDGGALRDPADVPAGDPADLGPSRAEQAADLDRRVAAVLTGAGARATVIVAALADGGLTPRLGLVAARGPGYAEALLTSSSTRQPGITQTLDLAPTILRLAGIDPPAAMVGSPLVTVSADDRRRAVLALAAASDAMRPIVAWVLNLLVAGHLLLYAGTVVVWRRRPGLVTAFARRVRPLCVGLAAVPVATFLADLLPWWRWGGAVTLTAATLGISAAIAAFALRGPWRRRELAPLAVVGGLTAGVLAVDVITGTRLSIAAPLGLQPLVAGRFYGFGNVQYALFATGCLLVAVVLAHRAVRAGRRRAAGVAVAAVGGFALVVDGVPGWGTDLGGPLSIVPGFALLALLVAGARLTAGRVAAVATAAAGMVGALALADWLRPAAQRTHLGRFLQSVIDGEAGAIVSRKVAQNVAILLGSPLTLLALGAALCTLLVLAVPRRRRAFDRDPVLRAGVLSLWTMLIIGAAVNDSGTAVPAMGGALAMPLLITLMDVPARDEPSGAGRHRVPAETGSHVE